MLTAVSDVPVPGPLLGALPTRLPHGLAGVARVTRVTRCGAPGLPALRPREMTRLHFQWHDALGGPEPYGNAIQGLVAPTPPDRPAALRRRPQGGARAWRPGSGQAPLARGERPVWGAARGRRRAAAPGGRGAGKKRGARPAAGAAGGCAEPLTSSQNLGIGGEGRGAGRNGVREASAAAAAAYRAMCRRLRSPNQVLQTRSAADGTVG